MCFSSAVKYIETTHIKTSLSILRNVHKYILKMPNIAAICFLPNNKEWNSPKRCFPQNLFVHLNFPESQRYPFRAIPIILTFVSFLFGASHQHLHFVNLRITNYLAYFPTKSPVSAYSSRLLFCWNISFINIHEISNVILINVTYCYNQHKCVLFEK